MNGNMFEEIKKWIDKKIEDSISYNDRWLCYKENEEIVHVFRIRDIISFKSEFFNRNGKLRRGTRILLKEYSTSLFLRIPPETIYNSFNHNRDIIINVNEIDKT